METRKSDIITIVYMIYVTELRAYISVWDQNNQTLKKPQYLSYKYGNESGYLIVNFVLSGTFLLL